MTGSTLLSIFVFEILQLEHTNSGDFHFWIPTSEFQGNWITAYWEWRQLPCHNDYPSSVFASSCDFGFSDNVLFLISVRLDPVGESGCLDICGNKLKHWIIMSIKVCVFLFLNQLLSLQTCSFSLYLVSFQRQKSKWTSNEAECWWTWRTAVASSL